MVGLGLQTATSSENRPSSTPCASCPVCCLLAPMLPPILSAPSHRARVARRLLMRCTAPEMERRAREERGAVRVRAPSGAARHDRRKSVPGVGVGGSGVSDAPNATREASVIAVSICSVLELSVKVNVTACALCDQQRRGQAWWTRGPQAASSACAPDVPWQQPTGSAVGGQSKEQAGGGRRGAMAARGLL